MMEKLRHLFHCVCILSQVLSFYATLGSGSKMLTYEKLRKDILSRPAAVQTIPPGYPDERSFNMTFLMAAVNVYDIDSIQQTMTASVYLRVQWQQKELAWNATDYNGLDEVFLDKDSIWTPEIFVIMGQGDSMIMDLQKTLTVSNSGNVTSVTLHHLKFSCDIHFEKYPFDTQACEVGFFPQSGMSAEIYAINPEISTSLLNIVEMAGEWSLTSLTCRMENMFQQRMAGNTELLQTALPDFPQYTFHVRRQRTYYIVTIIFPMLLTSAIIPLVFLIPVHTGEKMSYLVAVFTSTAIYINFISDVMPRGLSKLPYLALLLIEVLMEGFTAMLACLVVVRMHGNEEKDISSSNDSKKVFPVETWAETISDANKEPSSQQKVNGDRAGSNKRRKLITSHRLDIAFFFIFSIAQAAFLLTLFWESDWLTE